MKLFLDHEHEMPRGWRRVEDKEEALTLLKSGKIKEISVAYNLGAEDTGSGYAVLKWLQEAVVKRDFTAPKIHIHAGKTLERRQMDAAVKTIKRYQP